ncbi:MAG TPA: tetratricopeptide repeat protein [Pseudonocardiaceae bacterium]|nr:tetratricopeptide repeat protein [Pseudonocardiaceae bacterium]
MTNCPKAGCAAAIGDDEYCPRCGTAAPQPTTPQPTTLQPAAPQSATLQPATLRPTARRVTSQVVARGARRAPLLALPEMPVGDDHIAPVLDDPQVPEHKRLCPNPECRHKVGRARSGQPGPVEGFCPQCGTRFSFRPPLLPGVLVGDGQFQVEGAIAHGGLGWVYRAWDCWVPRWVVLKGLIDPDDPDNRQAAVAELAALADASHPNIVTVHTVVRHPHPLTGKPVDYIVMEYLRGKSLKQLYQERPDSDPYLPVDQVCGYALEVLAALDHLHEKRGLLYCDLSADNVIHSTSGVKLIDLGAVRRIDDRDSPVWGKRGFQDPEISAHGPSVATDLYTVARMMAVLSFPLPGFQADAPIPGPKEVPVLAVHPSFAGLLRRATNPDPARRFASAADMAEQLECVLREVRAAREDLPFPAASTRFAPELRVVGADPDTFPTTDPDLVAAALALPDPQVDPADPHAGLLAAISAEGPDETERVLAALPDPSLETRLRVVRARIELRHPDTGTDLDTLTQHQPGDWRVDWLRGLESLVDGDVEPAWRSFTAVLDALPGEAAPKLALAQCAARAGAAETAARGYATVWRTDRSYVSAAFGLARARFALGDHAGAAAALETVPEGSRYAVTARLCAILTRARGCADGQPPVADFFTAAEQLDTLELDDQRRELAVAEVLETVLSWERAGRPWPHGAATSIPATVLGHQLNERGVRDRLESAYRELARLAPTMAERITFVDKANDRRNRSWT